MYAFIIYIENLNSKTNVVYLVSIIRIYQSIIFQKIYKLGTSVIITTIWQFLLPTIWGNWIISSASLISGLKLKNTLESIYLYITVSEK